MFTNLENAVIWEKITIDRAPAYVRHTVGECYHESTKSQQTDHTRSVSREPENQDFYCIPAASLDYLPKPDDRILPECSDSDSPPGDALTVVTVKKFLYGSACVQHIEVTAK